ncbi:shikimate dehydrogenase [Nocardioides daphniae]|uniref:Shikimate 5-dehydrogenase n=1 Tax=Nocardioides daphniae TaxID=402297 RepID=A0A4P7UAY4_9ACTN|nr:shikimate dehydrogenase [Nocardioides daphniae]QCC77230.1 shikimate dehydrogenase [Nocardioides daphniae]GGD26459.1 shikimate 5-dehydrogenase [Nocardioides daphniae]
MERTVCGVLGDPISHSLSPVLHRAGYAALGLPWTYDAHRVPSGSLPQFLAGLDGTWRGLSLTMPLKREAVALVADLSERARRSGAVNTVVLDGHEGSPTLWGDNTDIPGAVAAIRERSAGVLRTATILGGGATATSVGLALVEMGVEQIALLVRTPERARETVEVLTAGSDAPAVDVRLLSDPVAPSDVVVSTVPASAQHDDLVRSLAESPVLFDVVYDPWPTPLAAAATGVVVSGLDLLVHQAAVQFTHFTGQPAPLEAMRAAGESALAARTEQSRGDQP